jgi:hypothetical protein
MIFLFFVSCLIISHFTKWCQNRAWEIADPKNTRSGRQPNVSNTLENDTTAAASEAGPIKKRGRPPIFTGHHTLIGNEQPLIQASDPVAGS